MNINNFIHRNSLVHQEDYNDGLPSDDCDITMKKNHYLAMRIAYRENKSHITQNFFCVSLIHARHIIE